MTAFLNSAFYTFDVALFAFFAKLESSAMNVVANVFSFFGSWQFMVILAIASIVLLFFKKTRKYGMVMLFSTAFAILLTNGILKPIIARPRPYEGFVGTPIWTRFSQWYAATGSTVEPDFSFPSGHTTFAVAVVTGLLPMAHKNHKKFAYWLIPIPLLIACSRIYLCVHYASDVIGGIIVGIAAGIAAYFIAAAIENALGKRKKRRRQKRSSKKSSKDYAQQERGNPHRVGRKELESFQMDAFSHFDYDAVKKYKDSEPKPEPSSRGGYFVDFDHKDANNGNDAKDAKDAKNNQQNHTSRS